MRSLILSCLLWLFTGSLLAAQEDFYDYYQFGNEYLHIPTLSMQKSVAYPAQTFKYTGKYAKRFERLAIDKLAYRGYLFEIVPNNGIKMTNISSQMSALLPNNEEDIERSGQNFMLSVSGGVIYVKHLHYDYGFMVYKYDGMGNEIFAIQLPHSEFVQKGSLEYHRPYLQYFAHANQHLVFTSYDKNVAKTHLIDVETGKMITEDFSIMGVVRSADDAAIEGYVRQDGNAILVNKKEESYRLEVEGSYSACQTAWKGDVLAMALYDNQEGGCKVLLLDWNTKNIRYSWTIEGRKEGHYDYYYNNVWLSFFEDKLIIEGYEKGGRYVHIYDANMGTSVWKGEKD